MHGVAKGLFALNAVLIRFVVVRNIFHFLTQEVVEISSARLEPQQFCFCIGYFVKHLAVVF